MKIDAFRDRLDRFGAALSKWPFRDMRDGRGFLVASDAARQAHRQAQRLERGIAASRPSIPRDRARAVVARAVAEIMPWELQAASPSLLQTALANPMTRTALVLGITAIGYGMGLAFGSPDLIANKDVGAGPFVAASMDDVSN